MGGVRAWPVAPLGQNRLMSSMKQEAYERQSHARIEWARLYVLCAEHVLSTRKTDDADGSWSLSWGCGNMLAGSVLCLLGWVLVICLAWPRMASHGMAYAASSST